MLLGVECPIAAYYDFSKLLSAVSVSIKSLLSGLYLTGLLRTITHGFRLKILGPSTKQPWFLNSLSKLFHKSCFDKTFAFPKITNPYFALVKATFNLLGSFKNPMPDASLLLTQESKMKSFSLP